MKVYRAKCKCGTILEMQIDIDYVITINCAFHWGRRQQALWWKNCHKYAIRSFLDENKSILKIVYTRKGIPSLLKRVVCNKCLVLKNFAQFIEIKE